MSAQIVREPRQESGIVVPPAPERGWKALAWFGAVLAVIGFAQAAVYLYPWGFGSREWEFGAAAQLLGALPLPTIGLAAMAGAAVALGSRRGLAGMTALFGALGLAVLVVLVLFWLVVPLALRMTPPPGQVTVRQTIARTTISGMGFGLLFLIAAVVTGTIAKRSQSRR